VQFSGYVALAARLMEGAGVVVMLAGAALAAAIGVRLQLQGAPLAYRSFRNRLGRAILLGLEFLVAADIIRTVSEAPTLRKVIVLAIIVVIRTFLSFTLELELEGTWPWRRAARAAPPDTRPPVASQ
jgi:uncharacterized membrane protein